MDSDERKVPSQENLPLHLVHCRAPPRIEATLVSSRLILKLTVIASSGASLSILSHATINFSIVDGKPGRSPSELKEHQNLQLDPYCSMLQ